VKLFVEGGGNSKLLRTKCRAAFHSFLQKAGLSGAMPRIVASGSRQNAYDNYCTAVNNGEEAMLLIDSEEGVRAPSGDPHYSADRPETWKPWHHLKKRKGDDWDKPKNGSDNECHLMVQVMESWFLADKAALKKYYGKDFNERALPSRTDVENISKADVMNALADATRNTLKGSYSKGNHSFDILTDIDPQKVMAASQWARRFVDALSKKMRNV